MINFFTEGVDFDREDFINLEKWIVEVIGIYNCYVENINYIFCSDEYLLDINICYLKHNYYTDIITFPYTDEKKISADIYISIERVEINAEALNLNFKSEFLRVVIHGILHLVGFNDKAKDEIVEMRREEDKQIKLYNEKYV